MDGELLQKMRAVSVEEFLLPLLLQLALILAAARIFAWLARRVGQPAVVGEIVAGLALGPSLLGQLAPALFAAIFRPAVGELSAEASDLLLSKALTALSQLGLILLLFLVGLEFDFAHLKLHGRATVAVSLAGLVVPFALGVLLGVAAHPLAAEGVSYAGFVLFLGTSMAITAMPVLGRMMLEWGVTRTGLATLTIAAAAFEDAVGWILLAAVAAAARSAFRLADSAIMLFATIGFAAALLLARPLLARFARWAISGGELSVNGLAALLVLVFLCAAVTSFLGIFAVFGAFLLGAVLSADEAFRDAVQSRLRDFVTSFFLPIFFAYTGLRTNVGSLESPLLWGVAAAVLLVAVAGKLGGCGLAGWLAGLRPREAACVGAMMNTRGLMELIVANLGKDLGVIPDSVYCMLVLMAVVTTVMTTPLVMRLMVGTELEKPIREAGFLGEPVERQ